MALSFLVVLTMLAAAATSAARAAGTTTTPSMSPITTSPGCTRALAQTTGTLTDPMVAFTVPLELMGG